LNSLASANGYPDAVVAASISQLRRLSLLCFESRSSPGNTAFINFALLHVVNASLQTLDKEGKAYFMLCIRFWQHLYVSYPYFRDITQAFLSRAMESKLIKGSEAIKLMGELVDKGQRDLSQHTITTSLICDFNLAMVNARDAEVRAIASKFDDLAMFDSLTTGEYASDSMDED